MRTRNNTSGLSILAGGLAFVGSANAVDLVVNGSFEDGTGWVGAFGTYNYDAVYYAGPKIPDSENPGPSYSWRHGLGDNDFTGPLSQLVNLEPSVNAADIDAGRGQFTLSAWMASYTENPDRPYVTVQFFDATGTSAIGDVLAIDRTSGDYFVQFADGSTTFDLTTHEHHWAKYVRNGIIPQGARTAKVGVTRSPNAAVSGRPDTYTDLVKLDVQAVAFIPPSVSSTAPLGTSVRPDAIVSVGLQDGTTQVNTNSLQLLFDGLPIVASVVKSGPATTLTYDPPGLLASGSSHTVRLVFSDNGGVPFTQTNQFNFTVVTYTDIQLNTPLHLETFDGLAEGALPAGWSVTNLSVIPDINVDYGDLNSAAYANWTVVDSARFASALLTYNTHTPETDYQRVLTFNPANVVNGQVVTSLAQSKVFFGDSGYRDGGSQIVFAYTGDYDVTGRTNIFLSFHSLYEQNQDAIGAVEYSINQGATWLPVVYYLHGADIVTDELGDVDAVATLSSNRTDIATYVDPVSLEVKGGFYGAFIGAPISQTLAPYLSARVDDNALESKRVELFRLPQADNQSSVRFRFAYAGTDSWYFGIDNFGLYSLPTQAPAIRSQPQNFSRMSANSIASFTVDVTGTPPFTYQWRSNGVDIAGATGPKLTLPNLPPGLNATYSVRVANVGGSVTSSNATLATFAPQVTGQWDFNDSDLRATVGQPMEFRGNTEASTAFTTIFFPVEFESAYVMCFSNLTDVAQGYTVRHGAQPNGGGARVNQYTLILDLQYPSSSAASWRALWQTDPLNTVADDADLYINNAGAIGIDGNYSGVILGDTWHRVAFVVDLTAPSASRLKKYIDGVKVGTQSVPGTDGRHSLAPSAVLFNTGASPAGNTQPGYVNSIQFVDGVLTDADIAALGTVGPRGVTFLGAQVTQTGQNITVRWQGAETRYLQRATSLTNPDWQTVPNTLGQSTHTEAVGAGNVFFRVANQ